MTDTPQTDTGSGHGYGEKAHPEDLPDDGIPTEEPGAHPADGTPAAPEASE